MGGQNSPDSKGVPGEAHLGARTTTQTRRPKTAPEERGGTQTAGALPQTVLYILYEEMGPRERRPRDKPCEARNGIMHAARA